MSVRLSRNPRVRLENALPLGPRGVETGKEREREREKVIASSRINARAVGGDQFEFPTPRLSLVSGEGRASPPRLPRVGARGGPVCRGQVRGSCPPGATLPTTAVGTRVVGAAWIRLVGGSRAARRYSGARSTNSQSSLAIRGARRSSMVTRCWLRCSVLSCHAVYRSPLDVNNTSQTPLLSLPIRANI